MTAPELVRTLADPRLVPFLPMIYLAWADGDLTPEEIDRICGRMDEVEGIDVECKTAFKAWLDPLRPPTPSELNRLLDRIRDHAAEIADAGALDVANLSAELARTARADGMLFAAEARALAQLDEVLGALGSEATAVLLELPRPVAAGEAAAAFDPQAMTELLDGMARRDIRQRMRRLLATPRFAHRYGLSHADHRELVMEWTQELADRGIGALGYPEAYGGSDSMSCFIGAFGILGHHDLSLLTKFGVQFGLFGGSILRLGTQRHQDEYLASAGSLALPGCFAMTETAHGSNVRGLETTATYDFDAEELVIDTPHELAGKDYIGNAAAHGRAAVVFAQLVVGDERHGVHAFVMRIRDDEGNELPGVRIEDCGPKLGLNGVDNGRIWFRDVRIPRTALLDRFAQLDADGTYRSAIPSAAKRFFTTIGTLVGGRVSVGHAAISAAKSAITIAVRYGARRRQFGPDGGPELPLLEYPTHQRRLLPRLATTYAYHFAFERLIDDYVSGGADVRRLEATAAGLKAFGTWHAVDTIQAAREACGGAGYLAENRLGPLRADSDVFVTYEGDNTVLAQLVTKSLLNDFRHEFDDMNLLGTIRYLATRAFSAVREANPLVLGGASRDRLRDRAWQRDAFRWREEHLLQALARRMKNRIDAGMDTLAAFNDIQDHVFVCARAHVERLVLDRFADAVAAVPEPLLQAALEPLVDLYALSHVERDRGWFQEHGQLSAAASKAVRKEVTALCREVRGNAVALVDGFGIPEQVLAAPIASG